MANRTVVAMNGFEAIEAYLAEHAKGKSFFLSDISRTYTPELQGHYGDGLRKPINQGLANAARRMAEQGLLRKGSERGQYSEASPRRQPEKAAAVPAQATRDARVVELVRADRAPETKPEPATQPTQIDYEPAQPADPWLGIHASLASVAARLRGLPGVKFAYEVNQDGGKLEWTQP